MALGRNFDIEHLITLVEARPLLWNKTLHSYKDKNLTKNAWTEICLEVHGKFGGLSDKEKNSYVKEVVKKWWNIRDCFVRSCKKQKDAAKSNAGAPNIKKYVYSDQLHFLTKVMQQDPIDDSLSDDHNVSQEITQDASGSFQNTECESSVAFKKPEHFSRKRKLGTVDLKMIKLLEDGVNRHLNFFKGIIPSLDTFCEDEVIKFQMGVLQLIADIRRQKRTSH